MNLFTRNRGLLYKIAQRYRTAYERDRAVDLDDLIQAGCLGLLEAERAWEPERGPWITVAAFYIRKSMRETLRIHTSRIHAEQGAASLDVEIVKGVPMCDLLEAEHEDDTFLLDRHQVTAALDELDASMRDAVWAHDAQGLSYQRIGDATGMSAQQAKRLCDTGRKQLRDNPRIRALAEAYALDARTRFYAYKGVSAFLRDQTSTTEAAALWRIEHTPPPK